MAAYVQHLIIIDKNNDKTRFFAIVKHLFNSYQPKSWNAIFMARNFTNWHETYFLWHEMISRIENKKTNHFLIGAENP